MKRHWEHFVDFYKGLGDSPKSWIREGSVEEKSIARTHTKINHVGEKPTYNKVCCCKLEQKRSEKEIKWYVVQQKWMKEEVNIHGEKHKIGQPKKVWEVCGSHLGSFSYFMYLNPTYELAFEGVATEVGMGKDGEGDWSEELLARSRSSTFHHDAREGPESPSLTPLPQLLEEETEDDPDLSSKEAAGMDDTPKPQLVEAEAEEDPGLSSKKAAGFNNTYKV